MCVFVLKHFDLHSPVGFISVLVVEPKDPENAEEHQDVHEQHVDGEGDPFAGPEVLNDHRR